VDIRDSFVSFVIKIFFKNQPKNIRPSSRQSQQLPVDPPCRLAFAQSVPTARRSACGRAVRGSSITRSGSRQCSALSGAIASMRWRQSSPAWHCRSGKPNSRRYRVSSITGPLGIADAGAQDIHQGIRADGLLHGERRPFGIVDRPHRGGGGGGDGEVGLRALLHVDHADLDGLAAEARAGAAHVEPFVAPETPSGSKGAISWYMGRQDGCLVL